MKIAYQHLPSPMTWAPAVVALLATIAPSVGTSQPSQAATLQIRGTSHLDVSGRRGATGVDIAGRLQTDDGAPIARAALQVRVAGHHARTVATDNAGAFGVRVPWKTSQRRTMVGSLSPFEPVTWQIRYDGDNAYGPAGAAGTIQRKRRSTRVDLKVTPRRLTPDGPEMKVTIWVREADGSLGIPNAPVSLHFDIGPSRIATTGRSGQVALSVTPDAVDSSGTIPVRAVYAGNDTYAPAIGVTTVEIVQPTRLNLAIGREGDLETGRYRFSGRLVDGNGAVPGATISLVHEGSGDSWEPLGVAVTDEKGIYVTAIGTRDLAARYGDSVSVAALYAPTSPAHATALSASARISLPGPEGVPVDWYLSCAAVLLGLLLLGQTLRSGAWTPAALWRRLHKARQPPTAPGSGRAPHPTAVHGAVGDDLRGDWIGGRLLDMESPHSAPQIRCLIAGPDGDERVFEDSRFSTGPLASGGWRMEVTAPGYLPLELEFEIPHDGHLDGATFALTSIRSYARSVFSRTLHRLDRTFKWGWDTPSEAVPAGEEGHALSKLRLHVERVWFGSQQATPRDASDADALAAAVDGEVRP